MRGRYWGRRSRFRHAATACANASLLFDPVQPSTDLNEQLREPTRIADAMFRQEHTGKPDFQRSVHLGGTKRFTDAPGGNGFADTADCVTLWFLHSLGAIGRILR